MNMVIHNGVLITMDSSKTVYEKGMVVINNDAVSYAGEENIALIPSNGKVIDARGGIIMPGLINTHTHIGMSLFRTLADDTADRLKKYLFPLEKKFVTPELVYRASLYSLTEMIEGGTTTFADMYYFEDIVADLKGGKGVSPALKMFDMGIPVGIGADGPMSGNTMDLINLLGYTAKKYTNWTTKTVR